MSVLLPFHGAARFLHPVLFIDDVELTKHSRNTIDSIHSTTLMLKSMKLKPALRDSLSGRRLTSIDIWRYCRRFKPAQLTHLPEEINASSSLETRSHCIICLDNDASTIVVPCGHSNTVGSRSAINPSQRTISDNGDSCRLGFRWGSCTRGKLDLPAFSQVGGFPKTILVIRLRQKRQDSSHPKHLKNYDIAWDIYPARRA